MQRRVLKLLVHKTIIFVFCWFKNLKPIVLFVQVTLCSTLNFKNLMLYKFFCDIYSVNLEATEKCLIGYIYPYTLNRIYIHNTCSLTGYIYTIHIVCSRKCILLHHTLIFDTKGLNKSAEINFYFEFNEAKFKGWKHWPDVYGVIDVEIKENPVQVKTYRTSGVFNVIWTFETFMWGKFNRWP